MPFDNDLPAEVAADFWDTTGTRWSKAHDLGCGHYHPEHHTECNDVDSVGLVEVGALDEVLHPVYATSPEQRAPMEAKVARAEAEVLDEHPELR